MIKGFIYFWGTHILILLALILSWCLLRQTFGHVLMASIAGLAIFHNAKINKRRATIDQILKSKSDERLIKARDVLSEMTTEEVSALAPLAARSILDSEVIKDEAEKEKVTAILGVLNSYEFIAAGVREGAFDYKMYHRLQHSSLCSTWNKLHAFVIQLRTSTKRETLFQEFEWMAADFKKNPLKKNFNNQ